MKRYRVGVIVKFVVALFIVGLILGILFFFKYKPDLSENIESFKELLVSSHQNTFISSITLLSAIFVSSLIIIGAPLTIFYVFYEGLSIGFTLGLFLYYYKFKGFMFYTLYLLSTKFIFILFAMLFAIQSLKYIVKFIEAIINKRYGSINNLIIKHFYRYVITLFIIILNSTIVYFISNKLINIFIRLIS